IAELSQCGLEAAKNDSATNFLLDDFFGIFGTTNHFGQVTEAFGTQENFGAWVQPEVVVISLLILDRTATILRRVLASTFTIEQSPLARLRLDQREKFFHDDLNVGLLRVGNGIICQPTPRGCIVVVPAPVLGVTHTVVAQ